MKTHHSKKRMAITPIQVSAVLKKFYGIHSRSVRETDAYLGKNYFITGSGGEKYVFKLSPPGEDRKQLEFENRVMQYLHRKWEEGHCPGIICRPGDPSGIIQIPAGDHGHCFGRLITRLPGKLLAHTHPHSDRLLHQLGIFMGRLDSALRDYPGPFATRELKWDLKNGPRIRSHLTLLPAGEKRKLVRHFFTLFQTRVVPNFPRLRKSLIHNDGNDYNLLTTMADDGKQAISGIVDFGDMARTFTVSELAITAAYIMLKKTDPLQAACRVIRGYHSVFPLKSLEIRLLYFLIAMRLSMSVVFSAQATAREPHNSYLQVSERDAWKLLKRLARIHPRMAEYEFRHACGRSPVPSSSGLKQWLKKNNTRFHPVLPEEFLKERHIRVFDLSVGSPDLVPSQEPVDMQQLSATLFNHLQRDEKTTGIGRSDEARLFYTTPQFQDPDLGENRTIHLGIDLFVPAGIPVHAPLEGKIHSLQKIPHPLDYGQVIILEHQAESRTFYTLYGHLSRRSLRGLRPGKIIRRGELFARIGEITENGGWPPHLHFQIIADMLDFRGDFPGVAPPSRRALYRDLCPDPNLILGIPRHLLRPRALNRDQVGKLRHRHLSDNLCLHYREPLHIQRGFMQYLYDERGYRYLDTVNNVCHVGHSNPRVVERLARQARVLNTNSRYYHQNIVQLARRITATLPDPLSVCFFVNSGSEANDLALRMARIHTAREDILALENGYHGNTSLLIDISHYKFAGPGGKGPKPWVHVAPMPDPYHFSLKESGLECGLYYARALENRIREMLSRGQKPAAFICETVIGVGGQIILPTAYLRNVYRAVRKVGGVCIADEVQVGLGRIGEHFWGFQLSGVVPDIVTIGKPAGNGHPLALVVTRPEIARSFNTGMEYFNTFGGNPVSCAAGLAVLDYIREHRLTARARRLGKYFRKGLLRLQDRHPLIGDVRGSGLFMGVELVLDRKSKRPAPRQADYVVERMKTRKILSNTEGPGGNVLKIKPPMVIKRRDIDRFLEILDQVLFEDFCRDLS